MRALLTTVLLLLLPPLPAAEAQTILATFDGTIENGQTGLAFDVLGDLNGDGVTDLVVGHRFDNTAGDLAGSAEVLSGADGSVLFTFLGAAAGDSFGAAVSAAGDVDMNGTPDVLVGAPGALSGKGAGWVYSGTDGAQLLFLRGENVGDEYGAAVDSAGDADGDGHDDVAVGAPGYRTGSGVVYVVSGATGSLLFKREGLGTGVGSELQSRYGNRVTGAGDLNGDQYDDLLVEATEPVLCGERPYYEAVSGLDGSRIRWDFGTGNCGHDPGLIAGWGTASAGDADGDGHPDYLVGTGLEFDQSFVLKLLSGPTGTEVGEIDVSGSPPSRARDVGDVDADGIGDYAVIRPDPVWLGLRDGVVEIYSGATQALLSSIPSPHGIDTRFGAEVRAMGDWDGDGHDDVAIGSPRFETYGHLQGRIWIFSGAPVGTVVPFCGDVFENSTGGPARMDWSGSASVSANDLRLGVVDVPILTSLLFIRSPDPATTPFGDGLLCVTNTTLGYVIRLAPGASSDGTFYQDFDTGSGSAPGEQVMPGSTWYFQTWFRDPFFGPAGFNFSDAICVTWAP